jgi:hypothetical protein
MRKIKLVYKVILDMTNEAFQELHDKRTRGLPLSGEELASLDACYVQQDQDEMALFGGAPSRARLDALLGQVQTANAELRAATEHVQVLTDENAKLRDEIRNLQRLVSEQSRAQPV